MEHNKLWISTKAAARNWNFRISRIEKKKKSCVLNYTIKLHTAMTLVYPFRLPHIFSPAADTRRSWQCFFYSIKFERDVSPRRSLHIAKHLVTLIKVCTRYTWICVTVTSYLIYVVSSSVKFGINNGSKSVCQPRYLAAGWNYSMCNRTY